PSRRLAAACAPGHSGRRIAGGRIVTELQMRISIMRMFVAGQWQEGREALEVRNPFDGSVIDTVPKGTPADVDRALATLVEGARIMRGLTPFARCEILPKAATIMQRREAELGRTISEEEGKILAEGNL